MLSFEYFCPPKPETQNGLKNRCSENFSKAGFEFITELEAPESISILRFIWGRKINGSFGFMLIEFKSMCWNFRRREFENLPHLRFRHMRSQSVPAFEIR